MQSRSSMKVLSRHDSRPRGTGRGQHIKERVPLLGESRCIVQNEMTALGVASISEQGFPRSTGFLTTPVDSVAISHVLGYPLSDAIIDPFVIKSRLSIQRLTLYLRYAHEKFLED